MKLLSGIPHANYWHIIGAHTPSLSLLSIYAQFWDYSFLICKAKIKFRDAKKTEKASVTGTLREPRNFFLYATTRIDPFTVFSTIDLDKLGNLSTLQETVYDICRLHTADHRLQTADCRLQTTDCRPQIADCKLKDTKNLPNKGDTIKNITSCESEKVAWEQGWYFCAKLHWPHFQDAVGYSSPTQLFIDSPSISLIALILYSSLIIVNW